MRIKRGDILVPTLRVGADYDEATQKALHASVEALGIIVKPIVRLLANGALPLQYELIDGYHRIAGIPLDQEIEVEVVEADDATALLLNVQTAYLKGKPNRRQLLRALQHLAESGYNLKTLSATTNIPYQTLHYLAEGLKWTDAMITADVEGSLPHGHIRKIAQAKETVNVQDENGKAGVIEQELTDGKRDNLLRMAIRNQWSMDELKAALVHPDAIIKGTKKVPHRGATEKLVCVVCGEEVKKGSDAHWVYICDKDYDILEAHGKIMAREDYQSNEELRDGDQE